MLEECSILCGETAYPLPPVFQRLLSKKTDATQLVPFEKEDFETSWDSGWAC